MSYPDESLDLRYLWRVFARYRWLIVVNAVLAGTVAAAVTKYRMKPVYKADATLLIPSGASNPLSTFLASAGLAGLAGGGGGASNDILAVLKSRNTAEKVVRALNLRREYRAATDLDAACALQGDVQISLGAEGQLIISASAKKPKVAAEIANAYPRILDDYRQSEDGSAAQRNLRFIERQLLRTRVELEDAEEQLRRFQQKRNVVSIESKTDQTLGRLNQAEAEQAALQITLHEQRERLAALQPKMRERATDSGAPALGNAGEVDRLRGKLAELQADYMVSSYAYQPDHPHMVEIRNSIEATKTQLQQWVQKSLAAVDKLTMPELIDLQVGIIAGEARDAALTAEIGRLRERADALPTTMLEFARLKRAVTAKDQVYQMLLQELYKSRIAADRATLPVRLLDPALPPVAPASPNAKRNILLGTFAGLFLGIVLAFFLQAIAGPEAPAPVGRRYVESEERERPRGRERDTVGRG